MNRHRLSFLGSIAGLALVACGGNTSSGSSTSSATSSTTAGAGGASGTATAGAGGSASTGSGGSEPVAPGDLTTDFEATELLGRPTDTAVALNLVPKVAVDVFVEYGANESYGTTTPTANHAAMAPFVVELTGLAADATTHYRVRWRKAGASGFAAGPDRIVHTQRAPGSTFRFTMQADSHLDENSVLDLYHRTLGNVLADAPDFHIDLGDTFMCEKHAAPLDPVVKAAPDEATVISRYLYERQHFGIVAHSVPLFLVNGNHDGELGYLFSGSGSDLATWTTHAREAYYLNPTPNAFYAGDAMNAPVVGQRAAWYAFTWGDALFVALDPFWNTVKKPGMDPWLMTLGKGQYDFLVQTLAASQAKYKFVFLHNLVGGLDGQQRGGVEAAPYFEWGGENADGSAGFAAKRPNWSKPIHDVLVEHKVTAVFHGHDHLYAHQVKDGVVYQEVPQPSAKNTQNGAMLASTYHYTSGTIASSAGHVRVTVSPNGIKSEYVRAWLPANESAQKKNGEIADTWSVP